MLQSVHILSKRLPCAIAQQLNASSFISNVIRTPMKRSFALVSKPDELTLLYGSQSGNAENLSKQLKEDLERRGIDCEVEAMNDVDVHDLKDKENIVCIVSTAGQGEFPANADSFYSSLNESDSSLLKGVNYAVFGLGDHGYIHFNQAAKDLSSALAAHGGECLTPSMYGDDRDDEKYETKYYEWLPNLYEALHCEKVVNDSKPVPKYKVEITKEPQGPVKPFKPLRSHDLLITKTRELTPPNYNRIIRHYEVDLAGSRVKYNLGDTLGIYPCNHASQVDEVLRSLNLNGDDYVKITKSSQIRRTLLPGVTTIRTLFTEVLDIFGRPTRRFYAMLSQFAKEPSEKARLESLLTKEGAEDIQKIIEETLSYADVLKMAPSAHPSLDFLVEMIPTMKPRYYSIASSPLMNPSSIHLCIVGVDWKTPAGIQHHGQCTSYLHSLQADNHTTIRAAVHPGTMTMPPDSKYPIIMAGLGTGIAPFKAIVENRVAQARSGMQMGGTALFYGCRYKNEFVYSDLWEQYEKEGVLTHVIPAFSREQSYKIYVQDRIKENSKLVTEYLIHQHGYFYYCGLSGKAPQQIREGIVEAFKKEDGMSQSEAENCIKEMESSGHYNVECW